MTNIVIIGTGALAADMTEYIEKTLSNEPEGLSIKGYIDYDYNIEKYWKRYHFTKPVLNDIDNYEIKDDEYYVVGIADVKFREKMINKVLEKNGKFINIVHPTAILPRNFSMGVGNFIGPHAIIGPNAQIGDFNLLLAYSLISHDCRIGNNNVFSNTTLTGHVKVGDNNFFGIRTTVIPGITIGNQNIVQAGMIVDKDLSDESTIFYRFKEKVIAIPR